MREINLISVFQLKPSKPMLFNKKKVKCNLKMDKHPEYEGEVSIQETINLLLSEDGKDVCDESSQRFNNCEILPPFYDEEKFKRGQQFFHKHIFAMLLGKLIGLMTVISTPTVLDILVFTKMSAVPMTAYKRYLATIFHMCVWYEHDFKPGSKLWRSIAAVKNLHNLASKRSCAAGTKRILQKDMGITQFGFMGYALSRPELIGIHNATEEEFEGFVHLWRVIGYIMGTEDRYNICRNSVAETKQICEALIEKVLVPNIKKQNPQYLQLADALMTGMWVMEPSLNTKSYIMYMHILLNQNLNNNNRKLPDIELTRWESFVLSVIKFMTFYVKYTLVRLIFNYKQYLSFWLLRNFPFLAFYKYGFSNSYVTIHIERGTQ